MTRLLAWTICLCACGSSSAKTRDAGDDTQGTQLDDGSQPGQAQEGGSDHDGGATQDGGTAPPTNLPSIAGCPIFTADDAWNQRIDSAAADATYSARLTRYLDAHGNPDIHPDFGAEWQGMPFGIPYNVVPESQPKAAIQFDYDDESDPGPYPFPSPEDVKIEGGDPYSDDGDRHILAVQSGSCTVYEAWACRYQGAWQCGSGAKFDLRKNSQGQRKRGFTSADAAGLSILAGLVRYDEVQAGEVRHAIRFTLECTRAKFTPPASHFAVPPGCDPDDADAMPMGVRTRLKASFDVSQLPPQARVIAKAMQTYGMILADNGSDFYFQGEADARWDDEDLNALKDIPSSAFEVVGPISLSP